MKKYCLLALFAALFPAGAQHVIDEKQSIVEAEMKSAAAAMNVQVNPNTLNYNVTYHKLEFTVDPDEYFIEGKVTTTFTALSAMASVTFDLTNELDVESVKTVTNVNLAFTQNNNDELVIVLPSTLSAGSSYTVVIQYSGEPSTSQQAFATSTHSGTPVLWTLSEPFGARDWWPCKQDLNDKIDNLDVYITAPSQYTSVANGLQVSAIVSGTSKTTYFHHGYPIPAYLVAIAVTNYSTTTQTAGTAPDDFPIVNYIYPESLASNVNNLNNTPLIMDFFEDTFGTYPFSNEKYGHAQFGWGGGMEHTTVSFMANFSRGLVAHELGHQWFGDKVTCGTWKDIWLNEGFATYMASMVIDHFDGEAAFIGDKSSMIASITSQPGGAVYLTDAEALNVSRIFSSRLSYNKGAMVLNMLRFKMGDTAFFQGLRNYLNDPALAYKYGLTINLKSHLEATYGSTLTEFFNDWVYNQGYPSYSIVAHNVAAGQVQFTINQTQSHPSVTFFEMPVPVRVFGSGGQQQDLVLDNTSNGQVIVANVPFTVTGITFDPKKELISSGNSATMAVDDFDIASVKLYPNPVADKLSLEMPADVTVRRMSVFNTIGQEVFSSSQNTKVWELTSIAAGAYLIRVETEKGVATLKFLKS